MAYNWEKAFDKSNPSSSSWENYPSENTALNAIRLNFRDNVTDIMDNRVIALNQTKLDTDGEAVKSIEYDKSTGIFIITYLKGTIVKYDTLLEKVAVNFDYDKATQKLIISLDDGTTKEVDLSSFIQNNEFNDTSTIGMSVDENGVVSANVLNGSITEQQLEKNYLSNIEIQADNAYNSSLLSRSYAIGGTGTRENEDTDNAKYYYEQTKDAYARTENVLYADDEGYICLGKENN